MANDSSTGGYLTATAGLPPDDLDLDELFQDAVRQISGLAGQYVRPRWQPKAPKRPPPEVNWCSIGVTRSDPDAGPYIEHENTTLVTDPSADTVMRHEELRVLASFYGPNAKGYADLVRNGFSVPQNTEALSAEMIRFVAAGEQVYTSETINQQQIRRVDQVMRFRRKVEPTYTTQNLQAAEVDVFNDTNTVNRIATATQP